MLNVYFVFGRLFWPICDINLMQIWKPWLYLKLFLTFIFVAQFETYKIFRKEC